MSAVPVGSLARVVVDSAYMWSSWTSGQLGATVVSSLAGGMLVLVLERQDDGCRILLPDGRTGWLRVSWLDPVAV